MISTSFLTKNRRVSGIFAHRFPRAPPESSAEDKQRILVLVCDSLGWGAGDQISTVFFANPECICDFGGFTRPFRLDISVVG